MEPFELPTSLPENSVRVGKDNQSAWRGVRDPNNILIWSPMSDKPKPKTRAKRAIKRNVEQTKTMNPPPFLSLFQDNKPEVEKKVTKKPKTKKPKVDVFASTPFFTLSVG